MLGMLILYMRKRDILPPEFVEFAQDAFAATAERSETEEPPQPQIDGVVYSGARVTRMFRELPPSYLSHRIDRE